MIRFSSEKTWRPRPGRASAHLKASPCVWHTCMAQWRQSKASQYLHPPLLFPLTHRLSSSLWGPVAPSFRALSGRLKSTADVISSIKFSLHDPEQLLERNVKRLRGALVFKAHRLCVSPNSRLESNKDEEEKQDPTRNQIEMKAPVCYLRGGI